MSASEQLRAVVFDLDGLLLNTEELYQFVGTELMRRRGKTFEEELIQKITGRPQAVALQMMIDWHGLDTTVDILAKETGDLFAEILDDRLALMPGAAELLGALESARVPKAIATGSGRRFTRDVLRKFHLEPRFEFILTGEDVVHGKPDPEIYRLAAAKFGLGPGQMMVLEDSQNGCRAAVTTGAFAVAVPSSPSSQHDFSGAALVVDSLADRRIYDALGIAGN
jgi:HAD superfamily hydrolase (TIGR01509 family)